MELSPKMNCFIGHNGEGKTNLLDAVYYLSFCHSAFTSIDSQVICHDQEFFVLEGEYADFTVSCGMKRGVKKHFKRDKKEYKRLSQHIGQVPLVFVSPSDQWLIEGGSEERRKLMDMVISQYDNSYIDALNRYSKALQQRNILLKMEDEPDMELMKIWEEQMAAQGELIYQKREEFVSELIPVFQEIYSRISDGSEQVSLKYVSHCQRGPLLEVIQRDRMKDRAVGYSLHGVHRDDLEMLLGGYLAVFAIGAITTVTEWRQIRTSTVKKILYCFTFPVFAATFIPIAVTAMFHKVSWKPIAHTLSVKRLSLEGMSTSIE